MHKRLAFLFVVMALILGIRLAETAAAHPFQIGGGIGFRPTDQQIFVNWLIPQSINEGPYNPTAGDGLADTQWPRYGFDNQNTSRSPYPSLYNPILSQKVDVPGVFQVNNPIAGKDGILYYEDYYKNLRAIRDNGELLWSVQLAGTTLTDGGLSFGKDDTLYVLRSSPIVLYAVNLDGKVKWQYKFPDTTGRGRLTTPLIDSNGNLYIAFSGSVFAIDPGGILKWKRSFVWSTGQSALTPDGNIIVAADSKIYYINSNNTIRWISEPVAEAEALIVNEDGSILSLGLNVLTKFSANGNKLWTIPKVHDNYSYGSQYMATANDGTIFVLFCDPYNRGFLAALDQNGNRKWMLKGFYSPSGQLTVTRDNVIYISTSYRSQTYAIHSSGALQWVYDLPVKRDYNMSTQLIPGPDRTLRFISDMEHSLYILRESPLSGLNAKNALAKRNPDNMHGLSFISDPIDAASGAQVISHTFLTSKGPAPFSFTLSYNSLLLNKSVLGKGWDHNYNISLKTGELGSVAVNWSSSRSNTYYSLDGKAYRCADQDAQQDILVKNADNTFTLTRKNQEMYRFNAAGQLTGLTDAHGRSQRLEYNSANMLSAIKDEITGSRIILTYNSSPSGGGTGESGGFSI